MPQAKNCTAPSALKTSVAIYAAHFGNSAQKHSRFALRTNLVSCRSVQNLATRERPADTSPLTERHFSAGLALIFLFLAVLWFVLWRQLSGEWFVNEQYSFAGSYPFLPSIVLDSVGRPRRRSPRRKTHVGSARTCQISHPNREVQSAPDQPADAT